MIDIIIKKSEASLLDLVVLIFFVLFCFLIPCNGFLHLDFWGADLYKGIFVFYIFILISCKAFEVTSKPFIH